VQVKWRIQRRSACSAINPISASATCCRRGAFAKFFCLTAPCVAPADRNRHRHDQSSRTQQQEESVAEQAQQFAFQAEVQRLVDQVMHSLYTDKEIFPRDA
jgi:hypothetical protein